jgi:hypothetical protein
MTLTTLLPSLRRTIPDPHDADRWPELTTMTTTDVIVSGIPLLRLVELTATPCVLDGAAIVPGTHGRPSTELTTTVLVIRVVSIDRENGGFPLIETDASPEGLNLVWSELRLIGRASTAHSAPALLGTVAVALPLDLRVGDLLAVPSRPHASFGRQALRGPAQGPVVHS